MGKVAFVTGAGGFVGRVLVQKLVTCGYKVYALYHVEKEAVISDRIIVLSGDLNEFERLSTTVDDKIDVFFHLAWEGISSADYKNIDVQKNNLQISISAIKLARALDTRKFVFIGTNQEYQMDRNSDGIDTLSSIYGVCKRSSREICAVIARNTMEFCATAFTNVFGPGDYSKRTANLFISKLLRNEPLDLIEGNNLYDWIYIDDAVEGLIAVGEKGVNSQQYYVGNRALRTFREIVTEVRDVLAPGVALNFGRFADTSYTDYSNFDLDALYRDTGFMVKGNFADNIRKTAEWVKKLEAND